jgi:hypothetical protein
MDVGKQVFQVRDCKCKYEREEGKRKPPSALMTRMISTSFTLFSQSMCYSLPHSLKHENRKSEIEIV